MAASRRALAPMVELEPRTHEKLQQIAREEQCSVGELVSYLVDRYEKERFWQQVRADYARLREDPVAWKDYTDEIELWDSTSGDGLENQPPYFSTEEEMEIRERAAARRLPVDR